jgi:hypothetical protein
MSERLKACPWCGSRAVLYGLRHGYKATCVERGHCLPGYGDEEFTSEDAAIKAWNHRPTESTLTARVEELEGENKRLERAYDIADCNRLNCEECDAVADVI